MLTSDLYIVQVASQHRVVELSQGVSMTLIKNNDTDHRQQSAYAHQDITGEPLFGRKRNRLSPPFADSIAEKDKEEDSSNLFHESGQDSAKTRKEIPPQLS